MKTTNALHTVLATIALAVGAQACCGLDPDEADRVLRVTVTDAPADVEAGAPETKLCGASIIATDEDGEQIELDEVQGEGGCEYVADVDPRRTYTLAATHPEAGGGNEGYAESNPACSTPTAPEDVDNRLTLSAGEVDVRASLRAVPVQSGMRSSG